MKARYESLYYKLVTRSWPYSFYKPTFCTLLASELFRAGYPDLCTKLMGKCTYCTLDISRNFEPNLGRFKKGWRGKVLKLPVFYTALTGKPAPPVIHRALPDTMMVAEMYFRIKQIRQEMDGAVWVPAAETMPDSTVTEVWPATGKGGKGGTTTKQAVELGKNEAPAVGSEEQKGDKGSMLPKVGDAKCEGHANLVTKCSGGDANASAPPAAMKYKLST